MSNKKDEPKVCFGYDFKIVITGNGDKTTAEYVINNKNVASAEVNRYYKDTYSVSEAVNAVTTKLLENKARKFIMDGDLVEVTEDIHGSPIPKGARGHTMYRYRTNSWLVDFHDCYGVTPWEIPESKIRKIDPFETNMQ